MIDLEELKAEAQKLGYKLVKNNPRPKRLPCKCGCKYIDRIYTGGGTIYYKCKNCGTKTVDWEKESTVLTQ